MKKRRAQPKSLTWMEGQPDIVRLAEADTAAFKARARREAAAESTLTEAAWLAWEYGLTYLSHEGVAKLARLIAGVRHAERELIRTELVQSIHEPAASRG